MSLSEDKEAILWKFLETLSEEQLDMLYSVVDYEFLYKRETKIETVFHGIAEVID